MLFNTEKLKGMPKKINKLAKREATVSKAHQSSVELASAGSQPPSTAPTTAPAAPPTSTPIVMVPTPSPPTSTAPAAAVAAPAAAVEPKIATQGW